MSPKQEFADSIAAHHTLRRLLNLLERSSCGDGEAEHDASAVNQQDLLRKERGWLLLESISSSSSIATNILESTGWLELLGILVGYKGFTKTWAARIGSAKALSRLLWDPKTGPLMGKQDLFIVKTFPFGHSRLSSQLPYFIDSCPQRLW